MGVQGLSSFVLGLVLTSALDASVGMEEHVLPARLHPPPSGPQLSSESSFRESTTKELSGGAYGGALQYLKWSHPRKRFKQEDRSLFYTCKKCKSLFKQHIKAILLRKNTYNNVTYKDDPAILAWEVANEPRAPFEPEGNKLHLWLDEMTSFIRQLDPNHLISIGLEGWFGPSTPEYQHLNPPTVTKYPVDWNATEGSDFVRNHNLTNVDIASFRLWNHWLPDSVTENQLRRFWVAWIKGHLEAAESLLNRPVILEEFGLREMPLKTRNKFMKLTYKQIQENINHGGAAVGTCFWMLADDGYPDYDGFTVYYPAHATTAAVIQEHSAVLRSHGRQYDLLSSLADNANLEYARWEVSWLVDMLSVAAFIAIPLFMTLATMVCVAATRTKVRFS